MIHLSRRRFLLGTGSILAAPVIVKAGSLMPVSVEAQAFESELVHTWDGWLVLKNMAATDYGTYKSQRGANSKHFLGYAPFNSLGLEGFGHKMSGTTPFETNGVRIVQGYAWHAL